MDFSPPWKNAQLIISDHWSGFWWKCSSPAAELRRLHVSYFLRNVFVVASLHRNQTQLESKHELLHYFGSNKRGRMGRARLGKRCWKLWYQPFISRQYDCLLIPAAIQYIFQLHMESERNRWSKVRFLPHRRWEEVTLKCYRRGEKGWTAVRAIYLQSCKKADERK